MIHFFINDDSCDRFHSFRLEAWKEVKDVLYQADNVYASSFTCIEKIEFHSSVGEAYQVRTFRTDFGKDSCMGHSARTAKDLKNAITNGHFCQFKEATKEEYTALREKVLSLYKENMKMNLEEQKTEGSPALRLPVICCSNK